MLVKHKVNLRLTNTERFYPDRQKLKQELGSVKHESNRMDLQLFNTLNDTKNISLRRAAILKVKQYENTLTAIIIPYFKIRCIIDTDTSLKILE